MTDKEIIIDGANTLKEKINMCFILLLNKLETTETIERTIYEHLDAFVDEWNDLFQRKEQECEELKSQLETYSKMIEDPEFKVALTDVRTGEREVWRKLGNIAQKYEQALDEIENYINSQGIDNKWNMYIQRFRSGILNIINKTKDGKNDNSININ